MRVSDPVVSVFAVGSEVPLAGRVVDVISGSFGAGHDAAAAEIARRLEAVGVSTRRWDVVDLMPGASGRVLRAAYLRQLTTVPGSWGRLLSGLERHGRLAQAAAAMVGSAAPRIEQLARDGSSSGFVSTHPFASQALGQLRSGGRLDVPAVTYLTDMSVHRLWVHPGVDVHLALHELPAMAASRLGARDVRVVRAAVPPRSLRRAAGTCDEKTIRSSLGLPERAHLALLTGGAYGIGELSRAAREVTATGVAVPVVLCGRNQSLRRRLLRAGVLALGWVDDVAALLSVIDVVIQNAGGFTSLESLASGVPVITYLCIPGHGEANAAALDAAGLVPWVRCAGDLRAALLRAISLEPRTTATRSTLAPDVGAAIHELLVPAADETELDLVPA